MLSHLNDKHYIGVWSTLVICSCSFAMTNRRRRPGNGITRSARQSGSDLKLMDWMNKKYPRISICNISSLCTSVNSVCDQYRFDYINRCKDDYIRILPVFELTLNLWKPVSNDWVIISSIYDLSSVWRRTINRTNSNLKSAGSINMYKLKDITNDKMPPADTTNDHFIMSQLHGARQQVFFWPRDGSYDPIFCSIATMFKGPEKLR